MKKLFTILTVLIALSTSVTAQSTFSKGDKILEGMASYSKESGKDAQWSIGPKVGLFLTDKFAIGLTGSFSDADSGKVTNYGVYGRCYFLNVGKRLNVFSELNVGREDYMFSTNLGFGANYFLTKNFALSANLFNLASYKTGDGKSDFNLGFNGDPLSMTKFGVLVRL